MSHYEERLEHDLSNIRGRVRELVERVDGAIGDAIQALVIGDRQMAAEIALGDLVVNRRVRKLDGKCHAFVALHLPSAGHLRFVSSVLRLSVALERVGDYAAIIARQGVHLEQVPPEQVIADFELYGDQIRKLLQQAAHAFDEENSDLATGTFQLSRAAKILLRQMGKDLLAEGEAGTRSIRDVLSLGAAISALRRVADQAENICEETIFVATGQMTKKRLSRVLFVAERDDALTQLAVAYATKAFSGSNLFASAGWTEAEELEPNSRRFMELRGLDSGELSPSTLEQLGAGVMDFEVVVSLDGDPIERFGHNLLPLQTVVVEWQVGDPPNGLDPEAAGEALEVAFRNLKHEIGRLMEMVRGKEVD